VAFRDRKKWLGSSSSSSSRSSSSSSSKKKQRYQTHLRQTNCLLLYSWNSRQSTPASPPSLRSPLSPASLKASPQMGLALFSQACFWRCAAAWGALHTFVPMINQTSHVQVSYAAKVRAHPSILPRGMSLSRNCLKKHDHETQDALS